MCETTAADERLDIYSVSVCLNGAGCSDKGRGEDKTRVRIIIMLWFPEGHGFSPMGPWAEKKRAKITFTRDHHE